MFSCRGYTHALVTGISGNSYQGFQTENLAHRYYENHKAAGNVVVKRNPGDEARFGPLERAMQ